MTLVICDQEAFYPFRALVEGGISSHDQLAEVERFIRSVVLHDDISMELEPWPYDPESDEGFSEEEQALGARNVIVAIGPTLDGFDFFSERDSSRTYEQVELPPALLETARKVSNDDPGEPFYNAHVEYLQKLVGVVKAGGSALVAGELGQTAINRAAEYPEQLFASLDADWKAFARRATDGDIGLVAPPLLSVVLTRAATRDAIPTALSDMRDEYAVARRKVWALLDDLKSARTIDEATRIGKQLASATTAMSPTQSTASSRPARVLWDLAVGGLTGGATAQLAHGDPLIGAITGVIKAAGSALPAPSDFGQMLFHRGAFDLARRVRGATLKVEYDALSRHLSKSELRRLEQDR